MSDDLVNQNYYTVKVMKQLTNLLTSNSDQQTHYFKFKKSHWVNLLLYSLIAVLMISNQALAHSITWSTSNFKDRSHFKSTLIALRNSHTNINEITTTNSGEWVIVAGNKVYTSNNFPASTLNKINQYIASGREIDAVAFTPTGGWVVAAEDWLWRSAGLPHSTLLNDKVKARQNAGHRIDEIAFTASGWTVISGNWAYSKNIPSSLFAAIKERHKSKRKIKRISIGPDGRWVLIANQWFASHGLSNTMVNKLKMWQKTERSIDHAVIAPGNSYVLYGGTYHPNMNYPMENIEYSLGPENKNIFERMQELKIPGVSIAVIENNKVKYARGYGTLEEGTQRWVRASSPFAAGSTSKLVAAIGVMTLVEDGLLDLDTELNEIGGSVGQWMSLGNSDPGKYETFDYLPTNIKVSQLLSHTANLNNGSIEIDPAYYPWAWNISTLSTLLGYTCTNSGCGTGKTTAAWYDQDIGNGIHGNTFAYSNKGYLVAQAAAETVTNKSFPDLMKERVLEPLKMNDSIYDQTLSNSWKNRTARRHDDQGNPLPWYMIPNYAAGGLFTTPTDYAKAMIMIMNEGWIPGGVWQLPNGGSIPFNIQMLSSFSIDEILTDRAPGSYEYGFGVELDTSPDLTFTHGGAVIGGASCMQGFPDAKEGIVIMINSEWNNAHKAFMTEIRKAFRDVYEWPSSGLNNQRSC